MLRELLREFFGSRKTERPTPNEPKGKVGDVVGYSSRGTKFVIESVASDGTETVVAADHNADRVCTLQPRPQADVTLKGKSIVLSGKLSLPRDQLIPRLEQAGARVTKQVSGRTDFVVNGDPIGFYLDDGTFKRYRWRSVNVEKAEVLGTHILDEGGLIELLNRSEGAA